MDDVATTDRGASGGGAWFGDLVVAFRANGDSDLSSVRTVDDVREIAAGSAVIVDRDNARRNGEVRLFECDAFRTTSEVLRRVQRELCAIGLCWPAEVMASTTGDLYVRSLPDSYRRVSDKERLLLWYAENFRRQFRARHAYRRPLLLACENECGVQRFVSVTVRRCTLPYPELYTWQRCANFISDYIQYEVPLPDEAPLPVSPRGSSIGSVVMHAGNHAPKHLRSPTWVLNFQKGNSFECATLLTSLLLGQGYNAFVVSGYASREQVLCDTSRRPCPYLPEQEERTSSPSDDAPKITKYRLKAPPDFRSQFLSELEDRERRKVEADLRRQDEERRRMIAESERPRPDKYFGHRIHAWVIILPEDEGPRKREIVEPIFIEPSTGVSYNPSDDETSTLYLGVESIWNDRNYWVNVQSRENGCATINWDLTKVHLWEHLLPGEPRQVRKDADAIEEDIGVEQDKHLDMPASYVSELRIRSIDFEKRYPNGSKTIFYKKAKVELYAPYVRADGLVQRVTVYEDYEYINAIRSYERYLNRSDRLTESRRDFDTGTITNSFGKDRLDHCRAHRYRASGDDAMDSERVIDFYDSAQFDGLSRIEMGPLHLTQHYVDREDFLYYRHAQFSADKDKPTLDGHSRHISKIIEKYHRNEDIPACKDVAVREFTFLENEIRVQFHYNQDQITRATRTFIKPSVADRGDRLAFDPAMTHGYNPDPTAPPEKSLNLFYDLDEHLKAEDHSVSCIRDTETEVALFLKRRADENQNLQLTISLFDRNRVSGIAELGMKAVHDQSQRDISREIDQLGPYLARIGNPPYISKAEAYLLRDECLNDFKQTSVDKANRILRMIEERASELEKMQALLTQTQDLPKAEEEQMLTKIDEMSFNVHVLDTYLNRHRDLVPERYRTIMDLLRQNPRLQALDWKY